MPVTIDDLQINVEVQNTTNNRGGTAGSASSGSGDENTKREMLEACLEKVMDVINHKNER